MATPHTAIKPMDAGTDRLAGDEKPDNAADGSEW
jgi:hypothetical protein